MTNYKKGKRNAGTIAANPNQQKEIDELKEQVRMLNVTVSGLRNDMDVLHSRLEVSNHVNSILQSQVADLQQYSRRHCLIMEGIDVKPNEKVVDVEKEVKNILVNNYNVNNDDIKLEFDKAHRIGKAKQNNQPVIVRFKSHSFRANLYSDRKRHQQNGKYKLRVCLTSQRSQLLQKMNENLISEKIDFCYANINGDLKVRLKEELDRKKIINIKSEDDIYFLLDKLNTQIGTYDNTEEGNDVLNASEI